MGLFNGISSFMGANNMWVGLTLFKLLGEAKTEAFITFFSSVSIQKTLDLIFYDTPLYLLVITLSIILLVIGMLVKDH